MTLHPPFRTGIPPWRRPLLAGLTGLLLAGCLTIPDEPRTLTAGTDGGLLVHRTDCATRDPAVSQRGYSERPGDFRGGGPITFAPAATISITLVRSAGVIVSRSGRTRRRYRIPSGKARSPSFTVARAINISGAQPSKLKLRLSGATYEDIAAACVRQFGVDYLPKGYDRRYACHDVTRELESINEERDESREALVRLELERLDRMLMAIWQNIMNGNFGAIDRGLNIRDRRRKMLGLDSPSLVAPVTPEGDALFNAAELLDLLRQADALIEKGLLPEAKPAET